MDTGVSETVSEYKNQPAFTINNCVKIISQSDQVPSSPEKKAARYRRFRTITPALPPDVLLQPHESLLSLRVHPVCHWHTYEHTDAWIPVNTVLVHE